MTSLNDNKVGRERMNIREQMIYLSFFVENALPIGDCMMSMPLMAWKAVHLLGGLIPWF